METAGENPVKTGSGGCGGERASTTNTGPDACNGGHTVTEPEKEPGLFKVIQMLSLYIRIDI